MTNGELVRIVTDLVAGGDIRVGEGLDDDQRSEQGAWAQMSVDAAREQVGWTPTYASMHDGVANYVERYRAFLRLQA